MSLFSEECFKKINNYEEVNQLMGDLAYGKYEISAKSTRPEAKDSIVLIPEEWREDQLICRCKDPKSLSEIEDILILSFSLGGEKYFTQMSCRQKTFNLYLTFKTALHRIQRREDFRLKIPSSFKTQFFINFQNAALNYKAFILDLSAGGLRIEISKDKIPIEQGLHLIGEMHLKGLSALPVEVEVKHWVLNPEDPSLIWLGVQIIHKSEKEKNKIAGIVLDLYRNIFSKYKTDR